MICKRYSLLMLGLIMASACRFPPPTRPESSQNTPADKELPKASPEELQRQLHEIKADQQSGSEDTDQKIRSLQDKTDVLQHNVEEDQKKSELAQQDFDSRVLALEKKIAELESHSPSQNSAVAPTAGTTAPTVVTTPTNNAPAATNTTLSTGLVPEKNVSSTSEQQYQMILDAFLEKKDYDAAIRDFKTFMQKYPNDPLKGNAQYWIAEGYFSKKDYAKAITEFQKVIDQYPSSSKKCDSLLKQGMAFSSMKDSSNAKLFLTETKSQCAGTEIAQKATKLLQNIK